MSVLKNNRRLFILVTIGVLIVLCSFLVAHRVNSQPSFRANEVKAGMSAHEVVAIMGKPIEVVRRPEHPISEEWHYHNSSRVSLQFGFRPMRFTLLSPQDPILVWFAQDGRVHGVWIPSIE